jgi:hypothetical protein
VDVSAERAAMKALRVECEDLRERLNKLSEENRLLVSNLHETHETLMEEKGRQKRRDEELEAAAHDGAELRDRVSALERRKIALEEELDAAKRSGADSVEAHERALAECRRREAALEADVHEALERLDLTARERDDLRTQLAALKDGTEPTTTFRTSRVVSGARVACRVRRVCRVWNVLCVVCRVMCRSLRRLRFCGEELERAQALLAEREKAEREIAQKLAQVEAEKEVRPPSLGGGRGTKLFLFFGIFNPPLTWTGRQALLQAQKATAQLTEEQSQQLAKSLSKEVGS